MNHAFLNFCGSSKFQNLAKDAIKKLRGGKFRGEKVFVVIERSPEIYEFHEGKVWNQMQSQDSPSFPEGYVRIRTDRGKTFDYNIHRERVFSAQFEFSRDFAVWRKSFSSRKAWILRLSPGTAPYELSKLQVRRRIAEEAAFSVVINLSSDLQTTAIQIIEGQIGIRVAPRPSRNEELGFLWDHYFSLLTIEQLTQLEALLREDGESQVRMAA